MSPDRTRVGATVPASTRAANLRALRSLSRAMFSGFVRDRSALIFTILIPVLFLVLFGSIYKSSSAPKVSVLEVGKVRLLDQAEAAAPGQLGKVLAVTDSASLAAALGDVRKGSYDAAVQQQGNTLVVHYSIASQTTAGVVQAVFSSIVQQADQAAAGRSGGYALSTRQVEDNRSSRSSTWRPACWAGPSPQAPPSVPRSRWSAGGRTSCCAGSGSPR